MKSVLMRDILPGHDQIPKRPDRIDPFQLAKHRRAELSRPAAAPFPAHTGLYRIEGV